MVRFHEFIFSAEERKLYAMMKPLYWLSFVISAVVLLLPVIILPFEGVVITLCFVSLTVVGILVLSGMHALKYEKYRTSTYSINPISVSIKIESEERMITYEDDMWVSRMTMLHGRRYRNVEEQFVVLWKDGVSTPVQNISPYTALEKYDIIILPATTQVLNQLAQHWGIDKIEEYPRCTLRRRDDIPPMDGSKSDCLYNCMEW